MARRLSIVPHFLLALTLIACLAAACRSATPPTPATAPAYKDVLIKDVPHIAQKPDFCGEACVEMALRHLGKSITQDQVFNVSGLNPALAYGCHTADLNNALLALGFKPGPVWYKLGDKPADQLDAQLKAMYDDLAQGIPSIVCMHYSDKPSTTEHFRLVLGYDAAKQELIYHEPAESAADAAYKHMKLAEFLNLWPLPAGPNSSVAIRLRLELAKFKDPPATEGFTNADYVQHLMTLKEKLPAGFSFVIQRPFIVIGNDPQPRVAQYATGTVKWAVDKLKQDYFAKEPAEILDIWLFNDAASYMKYTKQIFHDEPTTPYGYFSYADKALIMNISTGGGTLVHEIVHPFMRANFPECPPWFNEGLGSLYEQSAERDGHIIGLTNWRLPGLQKAIKADTVPSFEKLCAMDNLAFYQRDRGTNYGQSRYLCYYMQEKGLLRKFYQQFTANKKTDPTGFATLKEILGEKDMDAFKQNWEKWVLTLTFP